MVEINNLIRIYGTGDVLVKTIGDASFHVANGDMVYIMGKSVSGKPTLLRELGS
jgi:ABC-type lipoprotein export system ATPase subunit